MKEPAVVLFHDIGVFRRKMGYMNGKWRVKGYWIGIGKGIVMVVAGSAMMGISIDLFVRSGLGLDPLSVFQSGSGRVLGLSLGTVSQLLMLSIIVLLFFLDRKRIGLGTVLNSVLVGAFINGFSSLIVRGGEGFGERIACMAAGLVLMGAGIGLYVAAGLGEAGIDALMVYFSGKLKKDVHMTRIILDVLLSAAGFALGGTLGAATVLSMLLNGPIIQFTIRLVERVRRYAACDNI